MIEQLERWQSRLDRKDVRHKVQTRRARDARRDY